MPIDDRLSKNSRASLGIKDTDIVFAFAARGILEKGWIELTKAFIEFKKIQPNINAHLVLMGDGSARQEAQKLVPKDNKNIHFLGYESAVNSVLRFSDCLILPSRFYGESYPLCLIQAIQENLPCIATDIGEIKNMISTQNGKTSGILLENTKNDEAFIKSIVDALIEMSDDKVRESYQLATYEIAPNYDMKKLAEKYIEAYYRAINNFGNWVVD